MRKAKKFKPAHQHISMAYVVDRQNAYEGAGYPPAKWLAFCKWAIEYGFTVFLHESHSTVSKYIYLSKSKNGPQYKVRFSNHKPARGKELAGDCDYFVGVTHTGYRTTEMAIEAVKAWAKVPDGAKVAEF